MEALFQIGKELSELRSRVEALERSAGAHSEARSSSEYPSKAIRAEPVPSRRSSLTPAAITHRAPNVPLFLDGELLEDPEEITKHNGKPLYYTPLRIGAGIALAAFTDRQAMISESIRMASAISTESNTAATSEHICQQPPDNLPQRVQFFWDINLEGDTIGLDPGFEYRELRDWNDEISSVDWCCWDVSLYEDIQADNMGGSELFLPAGCNTPNLVILGWNDRASSAWNHGVRF